MGFEEKYSNIHNENAGLVDKAGTSNRKKKKFSIRSWWFSRYFDSLGGGVLFSQGF